MKEKLENSVRKRFKSEKFSKIILYRNPNEFTKVYIERVNPNHIGILWGKRKKKYNKGCSYIQWGKVYFSMFPFVMGSVVLSWFDIFTGFAYKLLLSLGIYGIVSGVFISILLYGLPVWACNRRVVCNC